MSEIDACAVDEIDEEDVLRFDHNDRTYVIIRMMGDDIYCMDGHCSHEQVHLCDGLVMDHVIECPKHNGRFDVRVRVIRSPPPTPFPRSSSLSPTPSPPSSTTFSPTRPPTSLTTRRRSSKARTSA